jgi:hypothetical protein
MANSNNISFLKDVKNFIFPVPATYTSADRNDEMKKDLSHYITPLQLQRLRHDVKMWREAILEAEAAYYPQRVKLQRLYIDTILNGHVKACIKKRRRQTTLRKYMLCKELSKDTYKENPDATEIIQKSWFTKLIKYIIDAEGFGYTLIAFGDLVDGEFPKIKVIKRWNVSPERENVTSYTYSLSGVNFLQDPYSDWHIWVTTDNENGTAECGYGYLYEVGLYEIILRNLLGFNGDFVEMFAQPYRVGKTTKTEGPERDMLESAMINMGSQGWAITDPQDEITFLETKLGGTGFLGYDNLEARCEKKVSKLILGHADALDSIPGKLGSEQGGDESPVSQALSEVQAEDGKFVEDIINEQVLPKLRNLGFNIPDELIFKFKNDDEVEEFRRREDASNLETANIALLMKNANLQMDQKYFTDRTGIPCAPIAAPVPPNAAEQEKVKNIQNKLDKLYTKKIKV